MKIFTYLTPGYFMRLTMLGFLTILYTGQALAIWDYKKVVSASECGECHEDAVHTWKKTKHHKNFKALSRNKDAKAIAKKMGIRRIKHPDAVCSTCHYTVGIKKGKIKIVAGVSCESCHTPSKSWLDVHNDYGNKGNKKNLETASHKAKRFSRLESLGMIRPDNIYGWAKNCLNCHLIANQKLVNTGGHSTGSDFKLAKRSQGKIRHTDKASPAELNFINLVGYATELELSMKALANASGGKFASKMKNRATVALKNLKNANNKTPNQYAKKIISLATGIKAGNRKLLKTAHNIAANTMRMVQKKTGYKYSAKSFKQAPVATRKPTRQTAPTPKPVRKVTTKPPPRKTVTKRAVKKPPPRKTVTKRAAKKPPPRNIVTKKPVKKTVPRKVTTKKSTVIPVRPPVNVAIATTNALPALQPKVSSGNLFTTFQLITPQNPGLCKTFTPWVLGEKTLGNSMRLDDNGCMSVKVIASKTTQLFLFAESNNGSLTQLLPNQCGAMNMNFNALSSGKTEYFPRTANQSPAVLQLNRLPGVYKMYGVLTDNSQANSEMIRLSNQVSSVCDKQQTANNTAAGFNNMLDLIKQNANGHMSWEVRSFLR